MGRQKGFTLVEAAIAIAVVAILSGIIVPIVIGNVRDARVARAKNDIAVIVGAIAHQLRDTGRRPSAAATHATGIGNAMWFSGRVLPVINGMVGAPGDALPGGAGGQTFRNLFGLLPSDPDAWGLFGFHAAAAPGAIGGYRGPYMGGENEQLDPWGHSYIILGYNQDGEASRGPIWVVSAGPSGAIRSVNLDRDAAGAYSTSWNTAGVSAQNIAVRVN